MVRLFQVFIDVAWRSNKLYSVYISVDLNNDPFKKQSRQQIIVLKNASEHLPNKYHDDNDKMMNGAITFAHVVTMFENRVTCATKTR